MDDSSKCMHLSNEEPDRISNLPDEMLHRILSFLETKEAVQKSLLSKRWVNLRSTLSCLNLRPADFSSIDKHRFNLNGANIPCANLEIGLKFNNYVDDVLRHCRPSFLHTFQILFPLILDKTTCSNLIQRCVSYAMKYNCKVFSIEALIPSEKLCACLFTCKSLEEICLRISFLHDHIPTIIPDVVDLPYVRRLHLKESKLDKGSISRLFSGCPVLEELTLENCFGELLCVLDKKLKYLHLFNCQLKLPQYKQTLYVKSCIQGNTVKSTIWMGFARVDFVWKNSGVSAVDLDPSSFMRNFFNRFNFGYYLRGLSTVTSLKLDMPYFQVLEEELKKFGEFQYLNELCTSGWCMTCNFNPVALFLQRSPNLKRLTLHNYERRCTTMNVVHTESWRNIIKSHKLEEALVSTKQVYRNINVVSFQLDKSLYSM